MCPADMPQDKQQSNPSLLDLAADTYAAGHTLGLWGPNNALMNAAVAKRHSDNAHESGSLYDTAMAAKSFFDLLSGLFADDNDDDYSMYV
ncbi:MAG: hypothetical protein HRU36_03665 [Rickettsiales bacterium]|nr:hypothetical protein [Rickettsiales bacterium]